MLLKEIIEPFLVSLINYFDTVPTFSLNKWLTFEFLCREFCENEHLKGFEKHFTIFYKKLLKYLVAYEKEKKDKLEAIIDWLRKIIVSKEKTHKFVLTLLETEYISILNSICKYIKALNYLMLFKIKLGIFCFSNNLKDVDSLKSSESCQKKILELIYWLPKVNRYLFTKLSILILNKKLSAFCINQVLGILKLK